MKQSYACGVIYAVLSGVFLSGAGLVVRYIEHADPWQVLLYRSLAFFITVSVFITIRDQGSPVAAFKKVKPVDFLASVALAGGFIFYVLSLFNTLVVNTVLMLSTGPFMAALLGWLFLREKVPWRTWVAMCVALVGIAIMVSGGFESGHIRGFIFALLAVLSFAIMIVIMRAAGDRDMLAATALAGLVAAGLCVPFLNSLVISLNDFLLAVFMGAFQVGLGFILITLASRSVPAAQVPLLALSETALAPLWVWWFVNEVPGKLTLVGGAVVFVAVIYQAFGQHGSDPAAEKSTSVNS